MQHNMILKFIEKIKVLEKSKVLKKTNMRQGACPTVTRHYKTMLIETVFQVA